MSRLIVAAGVLMVLASLWSMPLFTSALLASVVIAIGFVPMRFVVRHGVETLPLVWMGATALRLLAGVGSVALLVAGRGLPVAEVVVGVIGTYLVLLTVETASLIQLVRRLDTLKD